MEFKKVGNDLYKVVNEKYTSDVLVERKTDALCREYWAIFADGIRIHECQTFYSAEWLLRDFYLDQNDIDEVKEYRKGDTK